MKKESSEKRSWNGLTKNRSQERDYGAANRMKIEEIKKSNQKKKCGSQNRKGKE